jgi:hypothetical protein
MHRPLPPLPCSSSRHVLDHVEALVYVSFVSNGKYLSLSQGVVCWTDGKVSANKTMAVHASQNCRG